MRTAFKRTFLVIFSIGVLISAYGFRSDFFEIAKQIEIFTTLFKELNMNYVDKTSPAKLMDTAIKSMLEDLDPYTTYWNEQDVEAARMNTAGEYQGIGAAVRIRDNKFTIQQVYKGYPADMAGLKPGDEIIEIAGVSVSDFKEDAGKLLNGAPGSTVNITFLRQGTKKNTSITRGAVELKAVPYYKLLENNTGYIVLARFNSKASRETTEALRELKSRGADKIILDLRDNPGGLLNEAILVSNIFINKGVLITSTRSVIDQYNQEYYTPKEPVDTEIPLAVLINGRSASASEIVAGAVQDLDRGIVVGARSFGKGLVQRPVELAYGTQLKLTISRYYTPSGRCIQALDYRERDKDGNAVRIRVDDYNEFKTKSGRSVFDGGGILPDVRMKTSEFNEVTTALLSGNAIFDFATGYYYSHQLKEPLNFEFTDQDYNAFKQFLEKSGFSYNTRTETQLNRALATAKTEGYEKEILESYKQMSFKLEAAKKAELEDKKPEIKRLLTEDILRRYFYQEGVYDYYVVNNEEILKAREILTDPATYKKLLNP